jgi:hypothetical protein
MGRETGALRRADDVRGGLASSWGTRCCALSLAALAWNMFGIVSDVIELPYMANELALVLAVIGA